MSNKGSSFVPNSARKGQPDWKEVRNSETTLFTRQSEGQKSKNGDFMDFLWNTYFQYRFDGREKKKYSLSFFYNILIKGKSGTDSLERHAL